MLADLQPADVFREERVQGVPRLMDGQPGRRRRFGEGEGSRTLPEMPLDEGNGVLRRRTLHHDARPPAATRTEVDRRRVGRSSHVREALEPPGAVTDRVELVEHRQVQIGQGDDRRY